jgi:hypothetical protein
MRVVELPVLFGVVSGFWKTSSHVCLDRRNVSVSYENQLNHFQTVFPASDSEPKRFTRFYIRM